MLRLLLHTRLLLRRFRLLFHNLLIVVLEFPRGTRLLARTVYFLKQGWAASVKLPTTISAPMINTLRGYIKEFTTTIRALNRRDGNRAVNQLQRERWNTCKHIAI